MTRRFLLLASALLGAAIATAPASAEPRVVPYATPTMGTVGTVAIVTTDSSATSRAAAAALAAFHAVDARFSNWTDTSEIAGINRRLDRGAVAVSAEAAFVLATALRVHRASDGAFDPTVEPLVRLWGFLGGTPRVPAPERIDAVRVRIGAEHVVLDNGTLHAAKAGLRVDLGGIAKGHAVDRAVAVLRDHGIENALVDLSGNMIAFGSPPGRSHWTVGVRDPATDDRWFARLQLYGDAIATSGDYEQFVAADGRRYGHVLDPRTGWPTDDLVSATVVAPTAIEADAWATALLVDRKSTRLNSSHHS